MEVLKALFKLVHRFIIPCFFISFTWLLYADTLGAVFHFDDMDYIVNAPALRTPAITFQSLLNNFFIPGRELTILTFALNYYYHQLDVSGYHVVNICLHAFNGYLLFLTLQKLLSVTKQCSSQRMAIGLTCLFLSHPVAVNSVTYIAQRHVLLATLFYLLGFYSFLQSRYGNGIFFHRILWTATAFIAYWAAIHSKSMALTLPLICLITDLILSSDNPILFRRNLKFAVVFTVFFLTGLLFYAYTQGLFTKSSGTVGFLAENLWSPWTHFLTESVVFMQYWKILVIPWPGWLNFDHHFQLAHSITEPRVLLSVLAHLFILSCGVLAAYKRYFLASIGVFWFYFVLSPYLFVPILDVMVEYKTYLASPALLFIAADLAIHIQFAKSRRYLTIIFLGVFFLFCIGTKERNEVMETEISFWNDVILKDSNNYRAYNNLGLAYQHKNQPQSALIAYQNALEILPGYLYAMSNAGDSLIKMGRSREALELYKMVITHGSNEASTYFKAGTASGNLGLWTEALSYFKKAIELDPYYVAAWHNLGLTQGNLGEWEKAKSAFQKTVALQPEFHEAYSNYGVVLLRLQDMEGAEKAFIKSVTVSPSFAEGHFKLGVFYASKGDKEKAIQELLILQKLDIRLARQLKNYILIK